MTTPQTNAASTPEALPPARPADVVPRARHITAAVTLLDPRRARRAKVVLRVQRVAELGGSKYHWVTIKPLRVLKNTTGTSFAKPLRVAYYGGKPGVPPGTSTIYLEPYGNPGSGLWRLLDGDGAVGVSHNASP